MNQGKSIPGIPKGQINKYKIKTKQNYTSVASAEFQSLETGAQDLHDSLQKNSSGEAIQSRHWVQRTHATQESLDHNWNQQKQYLYENKDKSSQIFHNNEYMGNSQFQNFDENRQKIQKKAIQTQNQIQNHHFIGQDGKIYTKPVNSAHTNKRGDMNIAPPQILTQDRNSHEEFIYESTDSGLVENRSHVMVQSQRPVILASQINQKKSKSHVQGVATQRRKPSLNRNNIQEHPVDTNPGSTVNKQAPQLQKRVGEFGCLINANQPQNNRTVKVSQLQIQQQTSANSNNSVFKNSKNQTTKFKRNQPHSPMNQQIMIRGGRGDSLNNTQNFHLMDPSNIPIQTSTRNQLQMKGQGGSTKNTQNIKRQIENEKKFIPSFLEFGQSSGGHLLIQHGPSSATNKVKKAFDFDLQEQQRVKRDRKMGISSQALEEKKITTVQKKISNTSGIQNKINMSNITTFNNNTQKRTTQQKPQKIKTQMNMTGPLPKNLLGPSTVTNQSQGKSKHSQYFDNSSEVVGKYPQYQNFPDQTQLPVVSALSPQHQYQVQLNGQAERAQHQITTQGGNTVININIDSNAWQHPRAAIRDSSYNSQQSREVRNKPQTTHNSATRASYQVHPQVHFLNTPGAQNVKRQTSSKMRRNDSVSSNKSRRNGQNRRSSSSSHMQQQQQMQQIQQLTYNQMKFVNTSQNQTPHSNTQIISQNIAKINEKLLQQQVQFAKNNRQQNFQLNPKNQQVNTSVLKPQNKGSQLNQLNNTQKLMLYQPNISTGNTPVNRKSSHKQIKLATAPEQQQPLKVKKFVFQGEKKVIDGVASQKGSARLNKSNNLPRPQKKIQVIKKQQHEYVNLSQDQNYINQQDQHLRQMESQIEQNQLKLRKELEQMQSNYYTSLDDQMEEMGMDVDTEDINIDEDPPSFQQFMSGSGLSQQYQVYPEKYNTQVLKKQIVSAKRQQSQEEAQDGSQLRAPSQKRFQQKPISNLKANRNSVTSAKGRQIKKATRASNSKVNIEEINIDIDGMMRNQIMMDSSLGLAAAVDNFRTKKSVTTKNQNLTNKTQNVQSLLREAKREMLIDPNELDQIQVGGDDLTMKNQKQKKFNFNGTQNVNFSSQQNKLNIQYGISPKNRAADQTSENYSVNNYKSNQTVVEVHPNPTEANTFGLGQINMKKKIIQKPQEKVQSQFINQMQQQQQTKKQHPVIAENPQPVIQPKKKTPPDSQRDTLISSDQRNSNLPPQSATKDFSDNDSETVVQPPSRSDQDLVLPLSGAKVLKHYLKKTGLTEYEKSEILDYKICYFLGLGSQKIKGTKNNQYNFGYDDERGDYNVVLQDQIAYRFQVIDFLGKGSFGQALKCIDHKTGEIVAIKIIRNKKKFQHQAGVELKILLHLKENDPDDTNNIIRIKDYCMFRKHLIISFELFSINLYEFIKNNNFEGVSLSLIRRFAIQILQALKYLREENLIHCDLKPENILLKSPDKSGIKVIDFGSSCFSNERIYTYIQSRFYRAPEIIMGIPYTAAIDMWSFGCILTELFTGVPLFPGESEQEQLSLIMEVIGLPSDGILGQASRKNVFFDEQTNEPFLSKDSQSNFRIPSSKPLDEILLCQSDSFQDFISRCLEWDPEKRITPFEALMHEWIIEGLPPQVLIHHKKMLGIYESDTEDDQIQNSQSVVDDLAGEEFPPNNSEIDQYTPHHQDSNNLSTNLLQDSVIDDYIVRSTSDDEDNQKIRILEKPSIDFYGQDYGERYESILSNGANQNLQLNKIKINKNGPKKLDSKEFSRAGAKQENFNKTGKQIFEKKPQLKQVYGNKSEMGFDNIDEEEMMEMEMSVGIGNPDINRNLGIGMRGQKDVTQNRILLCDANDKSKTTNIQEILQQVNKKSKSTKHQVISNAFEVASSQRVNNNNFGKIKRNSFFEQQNAQKTPRDTQKRNLSKMEIDEAANNQVRHNDYDMEMDTEREDDQHKY